MDVRKKVAIMYDFDLTLAPLNSQEYGFIPALNMSADEFWQSCSEIGRKHDMDSNLAYMFQMVELAKQKNLNINYEGFKKLGKDIKYFEGVEEWFNRINNFAKELGIEVEHYIISSGTKEILEGTSIYHNFKRVYANRFTYNENGIPIWVSQIINYTTKTQFIFRVRKNILDDVYDSHSLNEYISDRSTVLPYKNMIYIGDGDTDVPSMKLVKSKGGNSICVYDPKSEKKLKVAKKLFKDERVNYITPADYTLNSKIDKIIKNIIKKIAIEYTLDKFKEE